jgi:hypothetical protein
MLLNTSCIHATSCTSTDSSNLWNEYQYGGRDGDRGGRCNHRNNTRGQYTPLPAMGVPPLVAPALPPAAPGFRIPPPPYWECISKCAVVETVVVVAIIATTLEDSTLLLLLWVYLFL